MPVKCRKRDDRYRIVNTSGDVERSEDGNPRDGGGHQTKTECERQAAAINSDE
jgi:hypothetical protein